MNIHYIIWLIIFTLGGISCWILGFADLQQLTFLIINPKMMDKILIKINQTRFHFFPLNGLSSLSGTARK